MHRVVRNQQRCRRAFASFPQNDQTALAPHTYQTASVLFLLTATEQRCWTRVAAWSYRTHARLGEDASRPEPSHPNTHSEDHSSNEALSVPKSLPARRLPCRGEALARHWQLVETTSYPTHTRVGDGEGRRCLPGDKCNRRHSFVITSERDTRTGGEIEFGSMRPSGRAVRWKS